MLANLKNALRCEGVASKCSETRDNETCLYEGNEIKQEYIKGFKNKQYTIKLVSNKFNNDSGKRLIVMILTQARLVKRVIIILLFKHIF